MIDQGNGPEFDYEWLAANEKFARFSKAIDKILRRFKGAEFPYIQGYQPSEKLLVVRERVPSRTDWSYVSEPGTNGNHAPIGKVWNNFPSDNSQ